MNPGALGYSGVTEDGERIFSAGSMTIDYPVLNGPVSRARRESLQLYSFLGYAQGVGGVDHELSFRPGEDPPDRYVGTESHEWATELTELTLPRIRQDFAEARRFGRGFQARLRDRIDQHPHLRGTVVVLTYTPGYDPRLPRDVDELAPELEEALRPDRWIQRRGTNQYVMLHDGRPSMEVGPFLMHLFSKDDSDDAWAVVEASGEMTESEAAEALRERVTAKDRSPNEALLITCGLFDSDGYTCPLDAFLYGAIREIDPAQRLPNPPEHLKAVALHLFQTHDWFEIYRAPGAPVPFWANA